MNHHLHHHLQIIILLSSSFQVHHCRSLFFCPPSFPITGLQLSLLANLARLSLIELHWYLTNVTCCSKHALFCFAEPDLQPCAGTTNYGWPHPCPRCNTRSRQQGSLSCSQVDKLAQLAQLQLKLKRKTSLLEQTWTELVSSVLKKFSGFFFSIIFATYNRDSGEDEGDKKEKKNGGSGINHIHSSVEQQKAENYV